MNLRCGLYYSWQAILHEVDYPWMAPNISVRTSPRGPIRSAPTHAGGAAAARGSRDTTCSYIIEREPLGPGAMEERREGLRVETPASPNRRTAPPGQANHSGDSDLLAGDEGREDGNSSASGGGAGGARGGSAAARGGGRPG